MKKQILNTLLIAFVTLSFTACKNDANKEEMSNEESAEVISKKANNPTATTNGTRYVVKNEDSSIAWEGNKPLGTHTGTISIIDGALFMDNDAITGGKFTIDMKSITVTDLKAGDGKEKLESHLMGTVEGKEGDFFNVNKYPTAQFIVTSIEPKEGMTVLVGDLTIKDKTNTVRVPVIVKKEGNTVTLKSEQFEIDRTKWGVNYGSKSIFDNLGDKFIDDTIKLKVMLVAVK